jgi:hypothetical protein
MPVGVSIASSHPDRRHEILRDEQEPTNILRANVQQCGHACDPEDIRKPPIFIQSNQDLLSRWPGKDPVDENKLAISVNQDRYAFPGLKSMKNCSPKIRQEIFPEEGSDLHQAVPWNEQFSLHFKVKNLDNRV